MWAITIIIEAYEGFHSSRLNMELEELEHRGLGKIVFSKVFVKDHYGIIMVKYLTLWYYYCESLLIQNLQDTRCYIIVIKHRYWQNFIITQLYSCLYYLYSKC